MMTGYQARTAWYFRHFGLPKEIHKAKMEDGKTELGVMEYAPVEEHHLNRVWWTYATNGMSERRMPCEEDPHGDPKFRLELITYSSERALWIVDLLKGLAMYPFQHRCGFVAGHTIETEKAVMGIWEGFVFTMPLFESEEINPLGFDIDLGGDMIFFLQVFGLVKPELELAIERGGNPLVEDIVAKHVSPADLVTLSMLDLGRGSLI